MVSQGETSTKKLVSVCHGISYPPRPPADWMVLAFFWLASFWCPLSQRLVRQKWAAAQRANHFKSVESEHFQHCLFAIHFFLCPVEGHEQNFQAASSQAMKREKCVFVGPSTKTKQYITVCSQSPKCFYRIFSSYSHPWLKISKVKCAVYLLTA